MSRNVTIMIHTDGELETRELRVPVWGLRAAQVGAIALGALVLLFFAFAGPLTRNAARAELLDQQVKRLRAENARVQELAAALSRAESRYKRLREMLGADVVPLSRTGAPELPRALPVVARPAGAPARYESTASIPRHWPIEGTGYITRGQQRPRSASGAGAHPGIDIAVAVGTAIRAAGGGQVIETGDDPEYGLFVRVSHPEGYESLYGHASRVFVAQGDSITAGQVIALSGNSGRSSAPHLHFEIRLNGAAIDPMTLVKPQS